MVSANEFAMPSLGADMDDGVIVEWLVGPGDPVERGQVVAVVETDKSEIDVEIFEDAVVAELLVPAGERVAVGTPIARLRPDSAPDHAVARSHRDDSISSPVLRRLAGRLDVDPRRLVGTGAGGRVRREDLLAAARNPSRRLTPRARRLAAEAGIEPADLPGDSVITGDDIGAAVEACGDDRQPQRDRSTEIDAEESLGARAGSRGGTDADPMRQRIASLMERSWSQIPHFHVGGPVDLTAALEALKTHNDRVEPRRRVLPAALLLYAVARAAHRVPEVNGWWLDGAFRPSGSVDLAVVVALRGGGIIAPTITSADELDLIAMMEHLSGVVGRARSRRLRTADTATASLTVTNLGDLGAASVQGVIHPPQVALVGFGAISDRVVAVDGLIGVRRMASVTVTGDHRCFDAMVAARFLARIAAEIESVVPELDAGRSAAVPGVGQWARSGAGGGVDGGPEQTDDKPASEHRLSEQERSDDP